MSRLNISKLQEQLLSWYARHRRVMPWRAERGRKPDPYRVWLSEIMLQQTTVVTVTPYFTKFIAKWPTVAALAGASLDEVLTAWAGLGYYTRARNLHKCAQIIAEKFKGKFPVTVDGLRELPGIGPYTAAAIASIAFSRQAVAVDGNVERVVSRFFAIEEPLPSSKEIIRGRAAQLAGDNRHPGDFTQAFMELGATVCTPRKPRCMFCPWQRECRANKLGITEGLPNKSPKVRKPVRYGKVFWIQKKSGAFLIEKRTAKGLYEGMYQLPTSEWVADRRIAKKFAAPYYSSQLRFYPLNQKIRHSFTHFDLVLEIWTAAAKNPVKAPCGNFVFMEDIGGYALPTLMQKAIKLCAKTQVA
ncbi:MAG: A/G-specific adenine glycosylase [Proteobacteria bacterium]|nr:A/G-specific adenine glycosylase [Pseudomonadota bacterium]